ncbi:NADP-dependent phosphogluconate dehydrogenase [Reinekea sp.]|jgi:6-phosphogluconate dehydrogenase|uniref:NADP-dependent phosphogluconate dehydrogenase n=1 Tax=Reinekea sp. TaxID=1970455 RepID=UPI00398967CD
MQQQAPINDIAVLGLGVMGSSLSLNLMDHGFRVAGIDLNTLLVEKLDARAAAEMPGFFSRYDDVAALLASLKLPRRVILSVPAGKAVDGAIESLLAAGLETDDIVIDTGNSLWTDSNRRTEHYEGRCQFFSTAVSGGEEGARFGPSLMASGSQGVWQYLVPMMEAISAKIDTNGKDHPSKFDGEPCAAYIGPKGSGHYVKMVHNGIEYADMQLICDGYQFMKEALGLSNSDIGQIFERWNKGALNSYLMEISADILQQQDPATGKDFVDVVLDKAGQKGTGLWTALDSLEAAIAAPTIVQAVMSRGISSQKDLRLSLAGLYPSAQHSSYSESEKNKLIDALEQAVYCSKICAYAQGFALMAETANQQNWTLDFSAIAKIWRGGCIIRAGFLTHISDAYQQNASLEHLLQSEYFQQQIKTGLSGWRELVAQISVTGVAAPALSASLSYFDSLRSGCLSANLIQAQRDYFGAHSYRRIDRPESESYHLNWAESPRAEVKISD